MSRQAGSIVRGDFKAAPDIRLSGPAAGGGYVLRVGVKVKVAGERVSGSPRMRPNRISQKQWLGSKLARQGNL
jgi:hypothetical protein